MHKEADQIAFYYDNTLYKADILTDDRMNDTDPSSIAPAFSKNELLDDTEDFYAHNLDIYQNGFLHCNNETLQTYEDHRTASTNVLDT